MPKYQRPRRSRAIDACALPLLRPNHQWFVYVLTSPRSTIPYIGKSNNLEKRLRQHNAELVGGARRTRMALDGGKGNWTRELHVSGFPDERAALQFEWRFQRERRKGPTGKKVSPLRKALLALRVVLALERPTRSALPFSVYSGPVMVHCETESARSEWERKPRH